MDDLFRHDCKVPRPSIRHVRQITSRNVGRRRARVAGVGWRTAPLMCPRPGAPGRRRRSRAIGRCAGPWPASTPPSTNASPWIARYGTWAPPVTCPRSSLSRSTRPSRRISPASARDGRPGTRAGPASASRSSPSTAASRRQNPQHGLPAAPSGALPGLPSPADGRHRRRELGLPPALRLSPRRDNHAGPAHLGLTCHHRRDGLLRDDQGIGSSRNAQEESLVLRAFLCLRYRRTAPLQQVRARPARMSQGPGARRVLLTGTRTGMSPAAFHRPRSRAPPTCATLACGARSARERAPVHHRAPSALRGRTQSHPVVRKTARSYPYRTQSYATPRGRTLERL